MLVEGMATGVCKTCETNKAKRRAVPKGVTTKSTEVTEVVHTDVQSSIAEQSIDGHKYAIGFADSFSRFISDYFIRTREECLEKFQEFCADIGKPKLIVSDGAKEFVSSDIKSFPQKESIRCETSAPYTQKNLQKN